MWTGAKPSLWPFSLILDQHALAGADQRVEPARRRAAAASRSRAARALTISRSSCGIRAAGVSGRGEKGKTCAAMMSQSSSSRSEFERHLLALGREAGDQVGADRRVGPRRLQPLDHRDRIGAAVAALHPLEDQVVARLQRQMEMRQQPRLAGDQLEQGRRRSRCCRARTGAGAAGAARRRAGAGTACRAPPVIAGDVDPGEDDLLRAGVQFARDRVAHRLERQRPARPARLPDRAEGAAMVAAGLDRDEAAHPWRKPARRRVRRRR